MEQEHSPAENQRFSGSNAVSDRNRNQKQKSESEDQRYLCSLHSPSSMLQTKTETDYQNSWLRISSDSKTIITKWPMISENFCLPPIIFAENSKLLSFYPSPLFGTEQSVVIWQASTYILLQLWFLVFFSPPPSSQTTTKFDAAAALQQPHHR